MSIVCLFKSIYFYTKRIERVQYYRIIPDFGKNILSISYSIYSQFILFECVFILLIKKILFLLKRS